MNPARLRAYLELSIVSAIWGIAGPVIKYALGGIPALPFLTYRFFLSSLVGLISFLILGLRLPKDKKVLLELLFYAVLVAPVSLGLLFFGLETTTVLDMSLITLVAPLVTSVAGVIFLKEHITFREKVGMGIALVGTLLTVIEPIIQNGNASPRLSGNILILVYLLTTAGAAVLAKKLLRADVDPLTMTNVSFVTGFFSLLPFALFTSNLSSLTTVRFPYHLAVFYMAFLSGTLAYYLANKAQKTIEVSEAIVFSYLYPLFSAPLAVFWLGERVTPIFVVGAAIIALGVAIAEIKPRLEVGDKKKYN